MDIQQIKYFLTLADELHFWNTSEKVGITQSALSRQIMALENELNLKLFYRDKRNVKLTAAGVFLKEKWQETLTTLDIIQQQAHQIHLGSFGTLKLAYPDSLSSAILPDLIAKISSAFPTLKIELLQLAYEEEEESLKNYKIDMLFSRDVNQSSFIDSRKVSTENLCLVVADDHDFKTVDDVTNANLSSEKFILTYGGLDSSYATLLKKIFNHYEVDPQSYISCQFGSTIVPLIKKGLGISILPQSYTLNSTTGVRFIPLPFYSNLYINWRKDDPNIIIKNILNLI